MKRLLTWLKSKPRTDYSDRARALFERFAQQHRLSLVDTRSSQVEVLFELPVQPGLKHALTLGLQNLDELNFGVEHFWSYFFPYEEVEAEFENILAEWMAGRARVVRFRGRGRDLELLKGGEWTPIYRANGWFQRRGTPIVVAQNL